MSSPAIFLDRDGTIIVERNYPSHPDQVALLDGAAAGLRAMARHGYPLVVVSNQSGIGRGYFSVEQANAVEERAIHLLASEGVAVAAWYRCPHAPGAGCECRKPAPGMVNAAVRDLDLDPARSFVIGDKWSDIELAALLARAASVTTRHGNIEADSAREQGVAVCRNLLEANDEITRQWALDRV